MSNKTLSLDNLFLNINEIIKNRFESKYNISVKGLNNIVEKINIDGIEYNKKKLDGKYYFSHSSNRNFFYDIDTQDWHEY